MSLISELKRRNVFRVGLAYVVMAWLVMQVSDVILNNVEAPGWVFHVLLLFLVIGFFFALFFAWAFELTPEGLKREYEVDRSQSITRQTGRKLDFAIIGVLALALAYFAYDKFVLSAQEDIVLAESAAVPDLAEEAAEEATPAGAPANSIAVLPFVNMSSDAEQEYFSDGLSEELLNLLARIPEMQVTSRSSAFSFKGKDFKIADVGRELKVAHVLEGSVRKSATQVRITAQLIRVEDDVHLWSETYDRTLEDVFAIQDEIAAKVVEQLKITLLGELPTLVETDPEAYNLYLQALQLLNLGSPDALELAVEVLQQALAVDPDYVMALTTLSLVYGRQALNGLRPLEETRGEMQALLDRALAIDPDNAHAYSQLASIALNWDEDLAQSARYQQRALQLDPTDWRILNNAATTAQALGRHEQAIDILQYLFVRDPLNWTLQGNLAAAYVTARRWEEAIEPLKKVQKFSPDRLGLGSLLGDALLFTGHPEEALEAYQTESDEEYRVKGMAMAYFALGREEAFETTLNQLIDTWGGQWPSEVAHVYAYTGDSLSTFNWLDKAVAQGEEGLSQQHLLPFYDSVRQDPRWAAFLERAGTTEGLLASIPFEVHLPGSD